MLVVAMRDGTKVWSLGMYDVNKVFGSVEYTICRVFMDEWLQREYEASSLSQSSGVLGRKEIYKSF